MARLLFRCKRFSVAASLATRLLQLSSGRVLPKLDQAKPSEISKLQEAKAKVPSTFQEDLSWLPLPPEAPGIQSASPPVEGAVCLPGVVVELLVLLAGVHISMGQPTKALCLCKWARHYAKEAHVDGEVAFADASLLASQIVAECPVLLKLAQVDDGKVQLCQADVFEVHHSTDAPEADAAAQWGLISGLRTDALKQAEMHLQQKSLSELGFSGKPDARARNSPPTEGLSDIPVGKKDNGRVGPTRASAQDLPGAPLWQPATIPKLHHLDFKMERPPGEDSTCKDHRNLFNNWNQRRAALLLGLAEAFNHQPGKTAEYYKLVALAGQQLRWLGEPSPPLCAQVWLHQLHVYRLQQEMQLGSRRIPESNDTGRVEAAAAADGLATQQFLRYFQIVVRVAAFIDRYCGSDLYLHRTLFSEALLLSVQMLALSKRLVSQMQPQSPADDSSEQANEAMLKRVAFQGAQLCMLALFQTEQQRQLTPYQLKGADLDATLHALRCLKPLVRLFLAMRSSYFDGGASDENFGEGNASHCSEFRAYPTAKHAPKLWLST